MTISGAASMAFAIWTTLPLWEGQTVEDGLGRGERGKREARKQ